MQFSEEVVEICTALLNCSHTNEIRALVGTRAGARNPEVQEAMWALLNSPRRPSGADACAIHYFDAVVHERIRARDVVRAPRSRRPMLPAAERVAIAERDAVREIAAARSWSELVQHFAVSALNLIEAESAAPLVMDDDPRFVLFLTLASELGQGPDADAEREWEMAEDSVDDATALQRFVAHARESLAGGDWRDLPLHGDSLATLRRLRCGECGAMSWMTFWNYIGRWDWERRKRAADGSLNVLRCCFCGSTEVTIASITSFSPELQLAALPAMLCCETERAQVLLMPPQLGRHDPAIGTAVRGLVTHLCGQSPRGRRSDLDAWDITFTLDAFAGKIAATSDSVDPARIHHTYLADVLKPLAKRVQSGEIVLDANDPEIARAVEDFRFVLGRGLMMVRSDFESRDPSLTALDVLVGFLNEQCGLFVAACVTYTTGAEEAVSAARWGEVSWLITRGEQAADKASTKETVRRYLKTNLELARVSLHFQMGEAARAAEEMLELVAYQRELLARSPDDLSGLMRAVDLAGSLNSGGDYLVRHDLATCRLLLAEALDFCERIERSPLFGKLPERSKQFWALTKSGALNNFARSCHEAKTAMIIAARVHAHSSAEHPSVRWYFQDGVTTAHLQASLEAIRNEFPRYAGVRGIDFGKISAELDRSAFLHYERALAVSKKHGLVRYASLQWSNLARLHAEHGHGWRAARCARRSEEAARASGHLPALVEATFVSADLYRGHGDRSGARAKLVAAYEIWARMRRQVVFDELRIAAGRQIDPIIDRIASTMDGAPPDEWIGTLERMKAGSLADGILAPPLRLADVADDDDLQRLRALEMRIVDERQRNEAMLQQRRRFFRARSAGSAALTKLEREHDLLRQSLLLRRPYLAADAPPLESSTAFLAALRARFAGAAFIGLWVDGEELLVYGLSPAGESFAFRHPFLQELRFHASLPFETVDQFLDAYRATAAADLPAANLARTLGGPWFRALWQHVEQRIGRVERAVISPHERLRGFPWATMWDGAGWAASRTVFSEIVAVAPEHAAPTGVDSRRLLVLADPDLGHPRFALPGARREAGAIAAIAARAKAAIDVRIGADATREALFDAAPSTDVVHFACHGSFDGADPWGSALYLSGGAGEDSVTMTQIAHSLKLRPRSLVVLSACDTGKAQYRAADEAAGLARSFHLAGAANVIAALWPVDDAATAELMTAFYTRLLLDGLPVAEALALAQRSMLGGVHGSPSRWGAFVLYER